MKLTKAKTGEREVADETKRISAVEAVGQILAILQNLKDGTEKMKILEAVAVLDGSFNVLEERV